MKKEFAASDILHSIKTKSQKRPFNITITSKIVDEFSIVCSIEKVSKSEVIEQLIKNFLETYIQENPEYAHARQELVDTFEKSGNISKKVLTDMAQKKKGKKQ